VHKVGAVPLILLLLTTAAPAQIPTKGNVFLGYSYVNADLGSSGRDNLNGWNGSLEGKVFPWVGIVADISGHYGTQHFPVPCTLPVPPGCSVPPTVSADGTVHSFLFGPRLSASVGKVTPFAHALFGASHVSGSASGFTASDTSFATALGGGIDYRLVHGIGWRVQGDWLQTRFFSKTQNNFRLSTGLVLHF